MKKAISLLAFLISFFCCYTQSGTAYNSYLRTLCECFQKDTTGINSMNDASGALGKCINIADTVLRNKAMKEKNILKSDVPSLIEFEKLFAVDLLTTCPGFMAIMEKLSDKQKRAVPKLPIVDTVSQSVCTCLKSKGETNSKNIATNNFSDCFKTSVLNSYEKLLKHYKIDDNNQEMLTGIGDLIYQLVVTNCKFYQEKLEPLLKNK